MSDSKRGHARKRRKANHRAHKARAKWLSQNQTNGFGPRLRTLNVEVQGG